MSFIGPSSGAVREDSDPESARPAQPAPSRGEGRQGLRPPRPGQPHQAGVLKTLAVTTAVLAVIGLAAWLAFAHTFLTCLGIGAFAGIVTAIAESGSTHSSGHTPSPSTPATPRERERTAASGGGLLCGLLLGYWFFDD